MKKPLALFAVLMTAGLSACSNTFDMVDAKPTVSLTAPSSVTTAGQVNLNATASDDLGVAKVDFYVDGTLVGSDSSSPYAIPYTWTAAQNGTHTVKVIATDSIGQTAETSQTVTVNIPTDTVKPVITITTDAPNPVTTAGNYNLTVTATDNVAVTSLTGTLSYTNTAGVTTTQNLGALPVTGGTVPLPADASRNGTYTLTLTATDAAGNVGTATRTITVNIPMAPAPTPTPTPVADTQAPTVTITVPSTITTAGNYDVTVAATDNVGVVSLTGVLSVNGMTMPLTFSPAGGTQTIAVNSMYNGTATLTVTAVDAAGNKTTDTKTVIINIR